MRVRFNQLSARSSAASISAVPTPFPCQSSRTAIPMLPTWRMRQRVGEVSSEISPTTSSSRQATSENNPSGGSERCLRHFSVEGRGICKVPAIARGPLKMRCNASQSSGSVWRTVMSMCRQGYSKSPRRRWRGLEKRPWSSRTLRRAGFFGRGRLLELLFYVRDAGKGADVDLVVVCLEALLALALGAASAQQRTQVAAQEAQGDREQRRVHEREDGVY